MSSTSPNNIVKQRKRTTDSNNRDKIGINNDVNKKPEKDFKIAHDENIKYQEYISSNNDLKKINMRKNLKIILESLII